MVHLEAKQGNHVFDLNFEERASLIRRIHEAYAAAVRQRQAVMIHPNDLGLLLNGYDLLHRRLSAEPAPPSTPQATSPRDRRTVNPLLRALRAAVTRNHAARCESCREIVRQVRQEASASANLIEENQQLRQTAADAQAYAEQMTRARDALICERDEALWKLRNAELANRHRSLPSGGR